MEVLKITLHHKLKKIFNEVSGYITEFEITTVFDENYKFKHISIEINYILPFSQNENFMYIELNKFLEVLDFRTHGIRLDFKEEMEIYRTISKFLTILKYVESEE